MKMRKILQDNKWLLLVIVLVLGVTGILQFVSGNITAPLYSQQEAMRWENGVDRYAQVSAFFDAAKSLDTAGISEIENGMLSKLSEDGYLKSEHSEKTWLDAYSGESKQDVTYKNTNMSVTVMGIGGDFFQFHPIPLKSGSYITANDINGDRVVIDRYVAWELYGSNDVVGMTLNIGNRTYTVAGVTDVPENKLYGNCYGENNRIYINYNELKAIDENAVITCFEAVLPNPITSYAYNVLASACGISEDFQEEGKKSVFSFGDTEVIENSNRYGLSNMINLAKTSKYRVARTNGIGYPFWENIARMKESTVLSIVKVQAAMLLVVIAILIVILIRARKVIGEVDLSPIWNRIREAMRVRARKRRDKNQSQEEAQEEASEKAQKDAPEKVPNCRKEIRQMRRSKKHTKKRRKKHIDEEEIISDDFE